MDRLSRLILSKEYLLLNLCESFAIKDNKTERKHAFFCVDLLPRFFSHLDRCFREQNPYRVLRVRLNLSLFYI